jgi:hypothetical protein
MVTVGERQQHTVVSGVTKHEVSVETPVSIKPELCRLGKRCGSLPWEPSTGYQIATEVTRASLPWEP